MSSRRRGYATACTNLGLAHVTGKGAEPNSARGREILTSACMAGESNACQYVGGAYLEGKPGFERDMIEARRFFSEACRQGFDLGCQSLQLTTSRSGSDAR